MAYVIWMEGWPNPSKREAQLWFGTIAEFTLEGKPHPRKLCEIEVVQEDVGKPLLYLVTMERYALPQRFKVAIEGERTSFIEKPPEKLPERSD